jgi:hypothetical protein
VPLTARTIINFIGAGVTCVDDGSDSSDCTIPGGAGSQNLFETIDAPTGTDPVADTTTDTLQLLTSGSTITITGSAAGDSLDFDVADNNLLEVHLKAVDAPVDEECLTYEATVGDFEWQSCASGGTNALLDGTVHTDTVAQAVSRGSLFYGDATPNWNELVVGAADTYLRSDGTDVAWSTITLGTNTAGNYVASLVAGTGIDVGAAGEGATPAVDFDSTEIGTTTWGSGAGVVWTFDASAGTDTTLTFGDGVITLGGPLIEITGTEGINYTPGSDQDVNLITVDVTGAPTFFWDESADAFSFLRTVTTEQMSLGDPHYTITVVGIPIDAKLSIDAEGAGDLGMLLLSRHDTSTPTFGSHLFLSRSQGTHAAPTVVADNDYLGILYGIGYDGTDYGLATSIIFEVDDPTPAATDMGGAIVFNTSLAGTESLVERWRIDNTGDLTGAGTLAAGTVTGANVTSGADPGHTHTGASLSGIDVSDDLNLTAGRSLTLTGDDVLADVELYTDTKCIWFEDPTATDDFNSIWRNSTANDLTLTELWAESDQTVTFMLQGDDGTPADIDSVDLAPAAGEAEDTSLDGDTTLGVDEELDLAVTSVANTPTWVSICWTFTWND